MIEILRKIFVGVLLIKVINMIFCWAFYGTNTSGWMILGSLLIIFVNRDAFRSSRLDSDSKEEGCFAE